MYEKLANGLVVVVDGGGDGGTVADADGSTNRAKQSVVGVPVIWALTSCVLAIVSPLALTPSVCCLRPSICVSLRRHAAGRGISVLGSSLITILPVNERELQTT